MHILYVCGLYAGSNIFGVQWLLLVVCQGGGVVMLSGVCDYELGICYLSCLQICACLVGWFGWF